MRWDNKDINNSKIHPGDIVELVYARETSFYNQDGDLLYELSADEAKSYIGHQGKIDTLIGNVCFFDDIPFAWPVRWVVKI